MPVDADTLMAFALASSVLLVLPGPTTVMVVSQALAHGRRVALASVFGVGLGDLFAASLSLVGVGAVLAASALAFTILKWIGAAYLVYIGIRMWRAPPPDLAAERGASMRGTGRRIFRDAFLVTLFNPKGIIFFVAFVPQFVDSTRPFAPQAVLLVGLFVLLGIGNAYAYVLAPSTIRRRLQRPRILRLATRAGAGLLVGAGLASAFARRPV